MKNTTSSTTSTSKQTYYDPPSSTDPRPKFLVLPPTTLVGGGGLIRSSTINRSLPRIILSFALVWLTVIVCTYHYHTSKLDSIIGQHSIIGSSNTGSSKFEKRVVFRVSTPNRRSDDKKRKVQTNAAFLNELPNPTAEIHQTKFTLSDGNTKNEDNSNNNYKNIIINKSNQKFGPAMSACLLIKDENPRLIEWLAYHYTVVQLRYLVVAVDPESLTSPREVILQRWMDLMDIQIWEDERYMNQTQLTSRLARTLRAKSNNDMEEFVQLHRERQKTFLARCNLHHRANNRTWVMHIDVDEYISYNYVHELLEPSSPSEERWNWTRSSTSSNTILILVLHQLVDPFYTLYLITYIVYIHQQQPALVWYGFCSDPSQPTPRIPLLPQTPIYT